MINLNGLKLKNRYLVAAGALEYGRGWPWERFLIKLGIINPGLFGAIITKTITLEPRKGNFIDPLDWENATFNWTFKCDMSNSNVLKMSRKVLKRVPSGWMNNMGWWNVGVDYYIQEIYPQTKHLPIIVNIGGFGIEEYLKLIEKLNPLDILGIEINISCPNVGTNDELRRDMAYFSTEAKRTSKHPLILKIGASEEDVFLSQTASACGFNAISGINAVPGLLVTKEGIFLGGQSGKRIKETGLYTVFKLKEALKITKTPIIGGGGVSSWKDYCDYRAVGADAVTFGSVYFTQPWKHTLITKLHPENK